MHTNLERRFIKLAVTQSAYQVALGAFRARYHLLFDALAADMGCTRERLGARLGFAPVPKGGNAVMNGTAEASAEDCSRLLEMYLDHTARMKK